MRPVAAVRLMPLLCLMYLVRAVYYRRPAWLPVRGFLQERPEEGAVRVLCTMVFLPCAV